jgi:hypothetical protein
MGERSKKTSRNTSRKISFIEDMNPYDKKISFSENLTPVSPGNRSPGSGYPGSRSPGSGTESPGNRTPKSRSGSFGSPGAGSNFESPGYSDSRSPGSGYPGSRSPGRTANRSSEGVDFLNSMIRDFGSSRASTVPSSGACMFILFTHAILAGLHYSCRE